MPAIRNEITGEEKNFADKQAVADFLEGRADRDDWDTGRLGKLPAASNADKPHDPVGVKVAVDDGRRADESAGRHLVDPVHSEEASAENQAKEAAEKQAAEAEAAQEQRIQADEATAAAARTNKTTSKK